MDTPERSKAGAPPAASAKAEDSPLFSFINSLSPIEPVKSAYSSHISQAYHSLNLASVSSIFSSPHDNAQKESVARLSIQNSFAEDSGCEACADVSDKSKASKGASNALRLFTCTSIVAQEDRTVTCTMKEAIVDPLDRPDDLPLQFDTGSPDHNTAPCHGVRSDLKKDKCRTIEVVDTVRNTLEKRKCLFSNEIEVLDSSQPDKSKGEISGYEFNNLLAVSADLDFDTLMEEDDQVQLAMNDVETGGYLLSKLTEEGDISNKMCPIASNQMYSGELVIEDGEAGHAQLLPGSQNTVSSEQMQDNFYEATGFVPLGCKVETPQQRGMRRRCLVFEAGGYSNRNMQKNATEDELASKCKGKRPLDNCLNLAKTPSPRMLRGIGLHLNALPLAPKDKALVIYDPMATALVPSSTAENEGHGELKLITSGKNFIPSGGELVPLQMNDDSLADAFLGNDQISDQISPQKKRRKVDQGDDGEACKRCSCKKSKCLKLYCECFAAGVYCSEPCTCQGCLNKPIHEEVVLSTRKQIEFRNPLAFAPKVIRTSDAGQEIGEESNKTPASARHKRGCNCKKSSCLKKYCECYQGGVGCSSNCRCDGCKNTFGRRDGNVSVETEERKEGKETEAGAKEEENDQQKATVQNQENHCLDLIVPRTPPFGVSSALVKLPNFSNAKPPRPSKTRTASSSRPSTSKALPQAEMVHPHKILKVSEKSPPDDAMPDVLRHDASPGNCTKTSSPNGKRVSPPHNAISISPGRKGGRKLILKSIPSFPSLLGETYNDSAVINSDSSSTSSPLHFPESGHS